MSLKTEITLKCKSKKSRDVMLSQLTLIQRGVKENQLVKRSEGDELLAIRSQLHMDLHDMNSGGNKTMALEHIAGLVGLILMTRAWEGYLVGTGVHNCDSFTAFMKDNGLDLKHVEFCLENCARELLADFYQAQLITSTEKITIKDHEVARSRSGGTLPLDKGRKLRALAKRAESDPKLADIYSRYVSGELSQTQAFIEAGMKEPAYRAYARSSINKTDAPPVFQESALVPEDFVRFALNFVADNFKDGIPTDLITKYTT